MFRNIYGYLIFMFDMLLILHFKYIGNITPKSPTTVSQSHSETIHGRHNITLICTALSVLGFADQYEQTKQLHTVCHLCLCLVMLFPLSKENRTDLIICCEIPHYLSYNLHRLFLFIYIFGYFGVLCLYNLIMIPLFCCCFLLYKTIDFEYRNAIWLEIYFICLYPLYFHFTTPIF